MHIHFCSLSINSKTSATRSSIPNMTTALHVWLYGRFIEIQSNLRQKKLHRTNQGSNFLEGSFSNRDNILNASIMPQSNLEEKVNPTILKHHFPSSTDLSIFTSIAPVFSDWSNKTT